MALSDNIWWTRKAKIKTEKRLLSNAFQAQLLLLWYSFCSVAAAIYYLKFSTSSEYAGVAWVVFSVLVLCVSGFINGLSYKERAAMVKDSYEALNGLYRKALKTWADKEELNKEYGQILSICENHADIDYQLAICDAYLSHNNPSDREAGLDRIPTAYTWLLATKHYALKGLTLIVLHVLPVVVFVAMELYGECQGTI